MEEARSCVSGCEQEISKCRLGEFVSKDKKNREPLRDGFVETRLLVETLREWHQSLGETTRGFSACGRAAERAHVQAERSRVETCGNIPKKRKKKSPTRGERRGVTTASLSIIVMTSRNFPSHLVLTPAWLDANTHTHKHMHAHTHTLV